MNKTLIALRGPSESGKSRTFRRLVVLLRRRAAFSEYREVPSVWNHTDFVATLRWHGTLVGLSSEGDEADIMKAYLPALFSRHCAVIVTATRMGGSSVDYVDALCRQNGYAKEVVDKQPTANIEGDTGKYAAADQAMALHLLDRIKAALK